VKEHWNFILGKRKIFKRNSYCLFMVYLHLPCFYDHADNFQMVLNSWSKWNLEMSIFAGGGKLEDPEKNPCGKPTNNSTHMQYLSRGLNPWPIGPQRWEASVLPQHHPCWVYTYLLAIDIMPAPVCFSSLVISSSKVGLYKKQRLSFTSIMNE
jgi:hypothetical protein